MRGRSKTLLRLLGRERPRAFAHLTDAQLDEAGARLASGQPSGHALFPPSTWPPTGFEQLSDEELDRRLEAARARLAQHHYEGERRTS